MPQVVHSHLFLHADDSTLTFQCKDVQTTKHQLNKDFTNLCEWFIDNKLKKKCTTL